VRGLALALAAASGCGSGLWLITPRPNTSYQEITRTTQIHVASTPPGATLYVDGAEAGATPRSIAVSHKELRRQRRQSIWLPIVGTALDLIAFTVVAIGMAESNEPEAGVVIGAVGLGVLFTDLYLITGRSVVNEGVDTIPAPVEIGVRATGFHDAARKIRVPDITRLSFDLVPLGLPPPPAAAAPQPAPAPATAPPPAQ
jgi:hypothetical protein